MVDSSNEAHLTAPIRRTRSMDKARPCASRNQTPAFRSLRVPPSATAQTRFPI